MFRNSILANITTLMTGTVMAQFITFLLIPVISRLYTPYNFGVMVLFATIANLISVVSCGSYEQAIVLPKDDRKGWDVLVLSLLFCTSVSFVCLLIILFFHQPIIRLVFQVESFLWLWFIPLSVWVFGLRLSLNYWEIRRKNFMTISTSRIFEATGNSGIKVISGLAIGDKVGCLIGGVIGRSLFPSLFLGIKIYLRDFKTIARIPKKHKLLMVMKEYRNFPFYSSWTALIVNLSRSIPIIFLAFLFDNKVVGLFGFADNALRIPIGIMGNSIRQVFLQWSSQAISNKKKISSNLLKATFWLFIACILPFGIILVFGQELFIFVFGKEWSEAGKFAQILSPWLATMCINPPSTVTYTVLQKQKVYLLFVIIINILRCFVFFHRYNRR